MQVEIVQGDITEAQVDYIIQQCNCLTVKAHGLAETLEKKFPHARLYGRRRSLGSRNLAVLEDRAVPGTAIILQGNPKIVCLFGQWRPGKISSIYFNSYPESNPPETSTQRLDWFRSALWSFGNYLQTHSSRRVKIALPWKIGCGLAGGNWNDYSALIQSFSETFMSVAEVTLYHL